MKVVVQEKNKTILVIVAGLLVISIYQYHQEHFTASKYLTYTATGIAILSFIPTIGKAIVWFWYKLAEVLGWVNSRIILSAVFFLMVLPLGSLSRLFQKNPLHLKNNEKSLFDERNRRYTKEDLRNIW